MNKTLDFAIIASGSIGYFMSIALVTTSFYKGRANKYLALSLFILSTITIIGWFNIENFVFEFLNNIMLEFLFGVILLTYSLIQIQHEYLTKWWYKWLYAPFICSILFEFYFNVSHSFDLYSPDFDILIYDIKDNASFLYNVILILWGRKLIKSARSISEDKKRWLLRLNLYILCLIIIWLLSNIEFHFFNSDYISDVLLILVSFLSWWVLYNGVFKLQIVIQKNEIHNYLASEDIIKTKAKKKINKKTTSKINAQLYALMDEEELYKNPLLSRLELATRLDTSEGYLSQIINQEMNKSVIQFVNEYRVEAAKNLLQNPVFNKYSIEAIGLEAGFKSKSAFYRSFRTSVGMSPGVYRKQLKTS